MPSSKNWWHGKIDWETPAGRLLLGFLATLPADRPFHFALFGSAPLQLTIDRQFMSADVDLFSDDDEDSPNRCPENTRRLWSEIFHAEIDINRDLFQPAITLRNQGYGESPPDHKRVLSE